MNKFIALLIDTLNHDGSISKLLDPSEKIKATIEDFSINRDKAVID